MTIKKLKQEIEKLEIKQLAKVEQYCFELWCKKVEEQLEVV